MRKILLLARNDLRLTMRDRASFFWMLVFPIVMMWFFGHMGGGPSGPPKVRLTVVDRDGGWLARAFVRQLTSENLDLRELAPSAVATAKDTVRTLTFPEGFTAKVLAGEPQKLRVEPEQKSDRDFLRAADMIVLRAATRTVGLLVEMKARDALPPKVSAAAAAAELDRLAARPRLVSLAVSMAGRGRPVPGGLAQSVPGMLTMIVLMMTVIYGGVFLTVEKQAGILRRQVILPLSRRDLFLGKLAGRLLIAGFQVAVLLAVGRLVFAVDFGRSPTGLALVLGAYMFSAAGLATLFGAVLRTPEQAASIGWITTMVMSALGGCWWPSEVMPRWLWSAGHVFPTAWAMDAFHALISFGRGFEAVLVPTAALLGFGVLCTMLGAHFLRPD